MAKSKARNLADLLSGGVEDTNLDSLYEMSSAIKDRMQVANTNLIVDDRMQVANTISLANKYTQVANTESTAISLSIALG
jgi:hypothetical protein